ncbi:inactive protein RESTRICTED TEV MOVEMENT 2-like [Andrographis paniculata]|uniref:inactive protein RESTRICTED TEV MOVEMENT 2-like n=1 Tax=Andrographis paniculata TaxID=175694 RepID=UPI0021E816B8|nr:inactive protein RESTRICTED TEV MOVEMENT 2-like [Andrographis paniculata]
MAMRATGGGGGSVRNRRRGVVQAVYEDFKPNSEWQEEDHFYVLKVNLPGFMKEQIKVSTRGRNRIIVGGERLVVGNKWSQFSEEFVAPGDDVKSVQVKFEGGILTIKVPKEEEPSNSYPYSQSNEIILDEDDDDDDDHAKADKPRTLSIDPKEDLNDDDHHAEKAKKEYLNDHDIAMKERHDHEMLQKEFGDQQLNQERNLLADEDEEDLCEEIRHEALVQTGLEELHQERKWDLNVYATTKDGHEMSQNGFAEHKEGPRNFSAGIVVAAALIAYAMYKYTSVKVAGIIIFAIIASR